MKRLIGFFTDGLPFDGNTIWKRGLGGSESAVYYMARELHRLDNEVKVVCNCETPGTYDGVEYLHKADSKNIFMNREFDIFIVSRFYNFFQVPFNSRLNVLWNHDVLDNKFGLLKYLPRIDVLFNLSRFHAEEYRNKLPAAASKIRQTRNGIDLELVESCVKGRKKNPYKTIYASRPERGLLILLESVWPRLLKRFPHLELYICGYGADEIKVPEEEKAMFEEIRALVKELPGVFNLGSLSKSDYYSHLAESSLMLYPCNFPEISCISAIEAQACGTPIVTTRGFALKETVAANECLVAGNPQSAEYQDYFIHIASELLVDSHLYRNAVRKGKKWVESYYTWPAIAGEWEEFFESRLKEGKYSAAINDSLSKDKINGNGILRKNLDALSSISSDVALRIENTVPGGDLRIVESKSGAPVIKNHIALHSLIDPESEAEKWVEASGALNAGREQKKIGVFGFGAGYHIKALLDKGCPRVTVIEPDPSVIRLAFEWVDFSAYLERITLIFGRSAFPEGRDLFLLSHRPTERLHRGIYRFWIQKTGKKKGRQTMRQLAEDFKENEEIAEFLRGFPPEKLAEIEDIAERIPLTQGRLREWQVILLLMRELKERACGP